MTLAARTRRPARLDDRLRRDLGGVPLHDRRQRHRAPRRREDRRLLHRRHHPGLARSPGWPASFELRVTERRARRRWRERFVRDCASRTIRFIANEPDAARPAPSTATRSSRSAPTTTCPDAGRLRLRRGHGHATPPTSRPSLDVHGEVMHDRYRVLTLESLLRPQRPRRAAAARPRPRPAARPHIYFEWTEGNPFANFLRFLLFGQGEVAPVTREVLREAEPRPEPPAARPRRLSSRESTMEEWSR